MKQTKCLRKKYRENIGKQSTEGVERMGSWGGEPRWPQSLLSLKCKEGCKMGEDWESQEKVTPHLCPF